MTKGNIDLCPQKQESIFVKYSTNNPKTVWDDPNSTGKWSKCLNIEYINCSSMDSEKYECKVCGLSYRLYYDDMC